MDRAVGLAAEILEAYERELRALEIVPSGGGVFEVSVDGDLVFSKKNLRRHAEPGEVLAALRSR